MADIRERVEREVAKGRPETPGQSLLREINHALRSVDPTFELPFTLTLSRAELELVHSALVLHECHAPPLRDKPRMVPIREDDQPS